MAGRTLTRAEVAEGEERARHTVALLSGPGADPENPARKDFEKLADLYGQLGLAMDALSGLSAWQIWHQVEVQLKQGGGQHGALVILIPHGAAAGAGIATFPLVEVAAMRLPETRRQFLGGLAGAALDVAFESLPRVERPNGDEHHGHG